MKIPESEDERCQQVFSKIEKIGASRRKKKDENTNVQIVDVIASESTEIESGKLAELSVNLPKWPDQYTGVPNDILRSALFGINQCAERKYIESKKVAGWGNIEIIYRGQELNQNDLSVWGSILRRAKSTDLGLEVRVRASELLKDLNKDTKSGGNRKILHTSIERLASGLVQIVNVGKKRYGATLIQSFVKDEKTKEYVLILDPALAELFKKTDYTWINWQNRGLLSDYPLAQWLHGFYLSHSDKPHNIKVETLRMLCGSGNDNDANSKNPKQFGDNIKKALTQMCDVEKEWSWRISPKTKIVSLKKKECDDVSCPQP